MFGINKKKGQLALNQGVISAILFGVFVITLSIVATIVTSVQGTQTAGTASYNISSDGLTGLLNMSNLTPTLGTILVAIIIIGGLLGFFAFTRGRG